MAQAAAVLNQYREVADEIVCAVDARVETEQLSFLRGYADEVIRCDVAPNSGIERNLRWLYSICQGDWLFRIDGDEAASPDLLALLPKLIRTDDVLQYVIPRRWVFPDSDHWLNEEPWSLDRNIRLIRNVPPLLRLEGHQHSEIELISPHRYVDAPIYHLDCILSSEDARAAKVERYETLRPGVHTEQGVPLNNVYLPERFATQPPDVIPPEAQPFVAEILASRSEGVRHLPTGRRRWVGGGVSHVTQTEVDRHWDQRAVPESAYRATWLSRPEVSDMRTGELRSILVVLRNDGTERWPWGDSMPEIRLATRWLSPDGASMQFNSIRTPFTADVPPGAIVRQPMTLQAPPEPGRYLLELDVVHEYVRWFGCALRVPVDVTQDIV